ncbi:hypothetical protein ACH4VR_15665 [Streptomyces sp. NPDC020883]|uniref:hypothetical protein n=1 Tax=unclassified Streptomyces TaxID=2593676 RepID=UPI0034E2A687
MSRIRSAAAALALAAFVSVLAVNTSCGPEDSGWGATLASADDSGWGSTPPTADIRPAGALRI